MLTDPLVCRIFFNGPIEITCPMISVELKVNHKYHERDMFMKYFIKNCCKCYYLWPIFLVQLWRLCFLMVWSRNSIAGILGYSFLFWWPLMLQWAGFGTCDQQLRMFFFCCPFWTWTFCRLIPLVIFQVGFRHMDHQHIWILLLFFSKRKKNVIYNDVRNW